VGVSDEEREGGLYSADSIRDFCYYGLVRFNVRDWRCPEIVKEE